MKCHSAPWHRRSIRLKGYDYSRSGAYFVTLCTQDRICMLGDIVDGHMQSTDAAGMVVDEWNALPGRCPIIDLDAFIVMPNHIHGIIVITAVGAGLVPALSPVAQVPTQITATPHAATPHGATTRVAPTTLGGVIGAFKSLTTVQYARGVKTRGWPPFRARLWQRNYYEHIVRDEESLNRIRQYIADNPARWASDRENPLAIGAEAEEAWPF